MSEGVDYAKVLLKSDSAHSRSYQHLATRIDVISLPIGAGKSLYNQFDPFKGDAVAHGVKGRASVGFDAMRERIRTCSSGEHRREAGSQLGIQNNELGKQLGVEQDCFPASRFQGND